jgi:TonB-linked SusC/RagA family outer membrane protein
MKINRIRDAINYCIRTKTWKIMRIYCFIFFLCIAQSWATETYSQVTKLTLKMQDTKVIDVLDEIENQSEFYFVFNQKLLDVERKVNVDVTNKPIEKILSQLFEGTDASYEIRDRLIILSTEKETEMTSTSVAQQNRITGNVKDENKQPLPGVTIIIKGTTNGTVTDIDGNYSIPNVPDGATLIFSFVGMKTVEIPLEGKAVINVNMELDAIGLEEVVAVGYGSAKKSDITGSITSVNSEELVSMPVKDALQGMQGKIAGVDITTNQRPGEVGSIKIRGVRSLSYDRDPLYVVDGMVYQLGQNDINKGGSIDNINPNDIEKITILKDASATAIYGSRGANGVILITTKHGKEGKVSFSYNGSVTIDKMSDVTEYMDAGEWLEYARIAKMNMGTYGSDNASYDADYSTWGAVSASFENIASGWSDDTWNGNNAGNFDWGSYGKQTGVSMNHSISASGGTEKFRGYGSFGYTRQQGTIKGQDFKRYTGKISIESNLNWFKMGSSINGSWGDQDYGYSFTKSTTGAGDYYSALKAMLPWTVPYDEDGEYIEYPAAGDVNIINPINELNYCVNQRQTLRASGSFYGEIDFGGIYKPLAGLRFRSQFGPEFRYYRNGTFNDADGINGDGNNVAVYKDYRSYAWTLDNLVYYNRTFAEDHDLGITLMQSASASHSENYAMTAYVATSDELWYNMSSNGDIQSYGSGLTEKQMESYMIRANYGYKDKYLLTASMRWDGASQLAEGNKWAAFPSMALAWRVDQEKFMENLPCFNSLKLRLGYGIVGNSAVNAYATKGAITSLYYNWGTSSSTLGYVTSDPSLKDPAAMANSDLTWEKTTTYNLGLDYAIADSRISGSIDVYKNKTDDLLSDMSIPSLTGYTSIVANVGQTKGWGIDLELKTVNVDTKDFTWSTFITWSKDKNEISALANGNDEDISNLWFVGEEIGVYYDYVYDGIWKTDEADEAAIYSREPGQIKVKDLNNDGEIDANNDKQIVGKVRPDWTGGITNTFNYKDFELSFFIYSRWGANFKNGKLTLDGRYMQRKIDYWVEGTNENAKYYSPGSNGEAADTYASSMNYQDGSFVKLRNIKLGYSVNPKYLNRLGVNSLKLYVQCLNPWMIYSKCDYLDTDCLNYNDNTTTTGSSTTTKSFVFGVNIGF